MGNKSSTMVYGAMESVNNIVNESLLQVTNECKTTVNVPQTMKFSCDDIDNRLIEDLVAAETNCKTIQGAIYSNANISYMTPAQITAMGNAINNACPAENYKACVVDNITQDAIVESRQSCEIDVDMVETLKNKLGTNLKNAASNEEDAFGKALQNLNVGGSSRTRITTRTNIINNITNTMNLELVNSLIGVYNTAQTMTFEGKSFSLKNATQQLTLELVSNALSENSALRAAAAEISTTADASASTQLKGITDMLESITGLLGSPALLMAVIAAGILFVVFMLMK
jgi:hypothetical protein